IADTRRSDYTVSNDAGETIYRGKGGYLEALERIKYAEPLARVSLRYKGKRYSVAQWRDEVEPPTFRIYYNNGGGKGFVEGINRKVRPAKIAFDIYENGKAGIVWTFTDVDE